MSVACVFCQIVRGAAARSLLASSGRTSLPWRFWIVGSFIPATRW